MVHIFLKFIKIKKTLPLISLKNLSSLNIFIHSFLALSEIVLKTLSEVPSGGVIKYIIKAAIQCHLMGGLVCENIMKCPPPPYSLDLALWDLRLFSKVKLTMKY